MQKTNYTSLNQWWEASKIYFKIIAIKFSKIKNQKEKMITEPDETKIETWQKLN